MYCLILSLFLSTILVYIQLPFISKPFTLFSVSLLHTYAVTVGVLHCTWCQAVPEQENTTHL